PPTRASWAHLSSLSSPAADAPWPEGLASWADCRSPWRRPPAELTGLRYRVRRQRPSRRCQDDRGKLVGGRRLSWAFEIRLADGGVEGVEFGAQLACAAAAAACKYHAALPDRPERDAKYPPRKVAAWPTEWSSTAQAEANADGPRSAVRPARSDFSHGQSLGIEERQRSYCACVADDQPCLAAKLRRALTAVLTWMSSTRPSCQSRLFAWRVCGSQQRLRFRLGGGRQTGWPIDCSCRRYPPPTSVKWRLSGSLNGNSSQRPGALLEPGGAGHAGGWWASVGHHSWSTRLGRQRSGPPPAATVLAGHPLAGLPAQHHGPWRPGAPSSSGPATPGDSSAPVPLARFADFWQFSPARLSDSGRYYCTPEKQRRPGIFRCAGVVQSPTWLTTSSVADGADCQRLQRRRRRRAAAGCCAWTAQTLAKPEALTRWFKNGVEIRQADARQRLRSREGYDPARHISTGALRFNRLGPEDSGEYICTAQNGFGKIERSLRLTIDCTRDSDRYSPRRHSSQPFPRPPACRWSAWWTRSRPTVTWELLAGTGGADRQQLVGNLTPEVATVVSLPGNPAGGEADGPVRLPGAKPAGRVESRDPGGKPWAAGAADQPDGRVHRLGSRPPHLAPGFDGGLPANYSVVFASTSDVASRFGIASTSHTGRFLLASSSTMSALKSPESALSVNVTGLLPGPPTPSRAGRQLSRRQRRPAHGRLDCQRHHPGAAAAGGRRRQGRHRRFDAAFRRAARWALRSGGDGGTGWSPYRSCELQNRLTGISFVNSYRLSACLLARPNICGPPVATRS
uniref:Ig-like domain-containing protein n=1 Tax=Macrostomum lignano TaxID=282301 RepID=A0A1I8JN43_9PLAT